MDRARSPLESPAIGTATNDLIQGCAAKEAAHQAPIAPEPPFRIAVAMSGGGFRAALASLGVIRFLGDVGLLDAVRYVSSVSGGSIANGLLATRWTDLEARDFEPAAVDELVVTPFARRITSTSLTATLVRNFWRTIGPKSRTHVLADVFDRWFFDDQKLAGLPRQARFVINAANLRTGLRFEFTQDRVGDWASGRVPTPQDFRLASAVAASAAVPGLLAPLTLEDLGLPCEKRVGRPKLVDGGAYDNLGLNPVDGFTDDTLVVVLNAGGLFRVGGTGSIPIVGELKRAQSLLYRQTTALRTSEMVDRFRVWETAREQGVPTPAWARRGVLFGLASTIRESEFTTRNPEVPDFADQHGDADAWRRRVALTGTSFSKFDRTRSDELIYRGWWLTGATIGAYHPELLPQPPTWRDLDF